MRLATLQEALGTLLLQPEGLNALEDDSSWQAYLKRSPHQEVLADYPRDRLALYHELIYNTFDGTLSSSFPFVKRFIGKKQWYALSEEYRRAYPNTSFYMHPCARDFPDFLSQQADLMAKYPFLTDLARYEQIEVDLYSEANIPTPITLETSIPWTPETFEQRAPFWNPVSHLLCLDYPIPALLRDIKAGEESEGEAFSMETLQIAPQPVTIFLYRDPQEHHVRFFELNALTASLFELSQENRSFFEIFDTLWRTTPTLQNFPLETIVIEGVKLLNHCHQEKMLLGVVPKVS